MNTPKASVLSKSEPISVQSDPLAISSQACAGHKQSGHSGAARRYGIFQTPPDLVVKFQRLDIINVTLQWV